MARTSAAFVRLSNRIAGFLVFASLLLASAAAAVGLGALPGRAPPIPDRIIRPARAVADLQAKPNPETIEGNALIFIVRLKSPAVREVVVQYRIDDPTASVRAERSGSITIAPGLAQGNIPLATQDDSIVNGDRTVTLTLTSVSGRGILENSTARGIVRDNDISPPPPVASIVAKPKPTAVEGQALQFEIRLDRPFSAPIAVGYRITGLSERARASRIPTIIIGEGQTSAFLRIPTVDDDRVNGERAITVVLTTLSAGAQLGRRTAVGVVTDNDQPSLPPTYSLRAGSSAVEGETVAFTVHADRPVNDATQRVGLRIVTAEGVIQEPWPPFAVFRPGQVDSQIAIATLDDDRKQEDRTISVTLLPSRTASVDPRQASATVLLRDNDQPPVSGGDKGKGNGDATDAKTAGADTDGEGGKGGEGWPAILPGLAALVAIGVAIWGTMRLVLPRFCKVHLDLGTAQTIESSTQGSITVLPPYGGVDFDIGTPVSIAISDCPILSTEDSDERDERN